MFIKNIKTQKGFTPLEKSRPKLTEALPKAGRFLTGFTLIETLIYIALFSMIIGGAFMAAYQLIDGASKLNTKSATEQEINFVLRKIDWALTGVDPTQPIIPPSGYSDTLTLTKYDGNTVDIKLNANKIEIKETAGPNLFLPLTTDNVKVTTLQFKYIILIGIEP